MGTAHDYYATGSNLRGTSPNSPEETFRGVSELRQHNPTSSAGVPFVSIPAADQKDRGL